MNTTDKLKDVLHYVQHSTCDSRAEDLLNQVLGQLGEQKPDELEKEITRLQEKYDENGYDCTPLIKLLRIEQHVDLALGNFRKLLNEREQKPDEDVRDVFEKQFGAINGRWELFTVFKFGYFAQPKREEQPNAKGFKVGDRVVFQNEEIIIERISGDRIYFHVPQSDIEWNLDIAIDDVRLVEPKEEQKAKLIEIMDADEQAGLYDMTCLCLMGNPNIAGPAKNCPLHNKEL